MKFLLDAVLQSRPLPDTPRRASLWTKRCAAATSRSLPAGGMARRTRAMLKVEDGCVNFCTYCIIPYARGPVRSLPLAQAVEQTRAPARGGLPRGRASPASRSPPGATTSRTARALIDLLEAVSAAAGDMRLRLGSLEPRTITEDFCRRAARLPEPLRTVPPARCSPAATTRCAA